MKFTELKRILNNLTTVSELQYRIVAPEELRTAINELNVSFQTSPEEIYNNFLLNHPLPQTCSTITISKDCHIYASFLSLVDGSDYYIISSPFFYKKKTGRNKKSKIQLEYPAFNSRKFKALRELLETELKGYVAVSMLSSEIATRDLIIGEYERLRKRTLKKVDQLSTLTDLFKELGKFNDFDQIINLIVHRLKEIMEVEYCCISLLPHQESDNLEIVASTINDFSNKIRPKIVLERKNTVAGLVLRRNKPVTIIDRNENKDQRLEKFLFNESKNLGLEINSLISIPLNHEQSNVGVLSIINSKQKHRFMSEDLSYVRAVGDQVQLALFRTEYLKILKESNQRLSTLNKVGHLLSSSLELSEILSVSMKVITQMLHIENCSLMVFDNNRQYLKLLSYHGTRNLPQDLKIPIDQGISGTVARTGKPLLIRDINDFPEFLSPDTEKNYKTRSALSVPLKLKDQILGVINVTNPIERLQFETDDLNLLETLANQIAHSLENSFLYKDMQEMVRRFSLLYKVGQEITSSLDLEAVIELILKNVQDIFAADKLSLMVYDQSKNELYIKRAIGIPEDYQNLARFKPGEGIAGKVFTQGDPYLATNTHNDPNYCSFQNEPSKTLICVPLYFKNRAIGTLSCERELAEDQQAFKNSDLELLHTISSQASNAIENANLYNDLLSIYLNTIQSLAAAIDAKDSYTHGHSRRVCIYSTLIAEKMQLDRGFIETLKHTALLHDIGKIGISEAILFKPDRLSADEFQAIKAHPVVGSHILESIEFLVRVRRQVQHHHERYDGKGYPDGLKGEEIPLGSRIIGVADAFDAMTSTRTYRRGMPIETALKEIENCSGTQFDPKIAEIFLKLPLEILKQIASDQADFQYFTSSAASVLSATAEEK